MLHDRLVPITGEIGSQPSVGDRHVQPSHKAQRWQNDRSVSDDIRKRKKFYGKTSVKLILLSQNLKKKNNIRSANIVLQVSKNAISITKSYRSRRAIVSNTFQQTSQPLNIFKQLLNLTAGTACTAKCSASHEI